MAAKFDKEMMKKQHFWLLLIPMMIGLLLAWIGLFVGVADATDEKAKANDDQKKLVDAAKAQPRKTLELYEVRKNELFVLRTLRWKEMWDLQQGIYEWPNSLGDEQIAKVKDLSFGAEISDTSFLNAFRDHYAKEYEVVAKAAAPLQFAGSWQAVLRYVPKWTRNPESEDVWLAAEDFWVEKELVRALAEVNKDAARFDRVPPAAGTADDPRHRSFYNRTWQVDLQISDEKGGGTAIRGSIKNRTDRLQPFNVTNELVLNVWLSEDGSARPFRFAIEGTALEGGKEAKIDFVAKKHVVFEGSVRELYKVEQVYDVRTAPVKRLDRMVLGYLSARHYQAELQPTAFSTKAIEGDKSTTAAAPTVGPSTIGGASGITMPGMSGMPGMTGGGDGASAATTYNGLSRRRYIHRTDQVRAMPIGLVIIADQAFTQDVLTTLANCKLKFQTVQTHLTRFRDSISYVSASTSSSPVGPFGPGSPPPPSGGGEATPGGGSPKPGGGGLTMGPGIPGGPIMPGFPGMPGMAGLMGGGMRSSSEDQVAGNMVEIGIYGIASLYEKFQLTPAKKDDAGTVPPATLPVTPGVPGAPAIPGDPKTPATPPETPMPPMGTPPETPMPPKK